MSDITTYLNDNAPLGHLLSIRYTINFAANMATNRTDGAYALVYRSYSVDRRRCNKQRSVVDQKQDQCYIETRKAMQRALTLTAF